MRKNGEYRNAVGIQDHPLVQSQGLERDHGLSCLSQPALGHVKGNARGGGTLHLYLLVLLTGSLTAVYMRYTTMWLTTCLIPPVLATSLLVSQIPLIFPIYSQECA